MDISQYHELAREIIIRSPHHTKAIVIAVIILIIILVPVVAFLIWYFKYKTTITFARALLRVVLRIITCCRARKARTTSEV